MSNAPILQKCSSLALLFDFTPKKIWLSSNVRIATSKSETMSKFKSYLLNKFKVTDLKEVPYFIGIKIDRNRSQICLSQSAYIKNVLRKM